MIKKAFFIFFILFSFSSCFRVEEKLEPKISYSLKEDYIKSLKSPFKPLNLEEKTQDWAKEYIIAKRFAEELDLYRAITNFKRAEILIEDNEYRKQEIQYNIVLCYYLAQKYLDLIDFFEKSSLCYVDKSFPAFEDLLVILYESYHELKNQEKTKKTLEILQEYYPETEKKITLSTSLINADINTLSKNYKHLTYVNDILKTYSKEKKSIHKAQFLNALIPGAGYLYIGQKKTALTAFLLNGLFIYASYEFFNQGWKAAGIITASFEAGWYFGGIYGAGEEANFYNERLFENLATPVLKKQKLFSIYLIKYGF